MITEKELKLNDRETSELLIKELYIDLRDKVNKWSKITNQTPQARMGYIGQHLTSIVTGYKGSSSGARGHDLIIDEEKNLYGEIKTCYRVDQLGRCNDCLRNVPGISDVCPNCNSKNIKRNDDSKWLITIRNDDEFINILEPLYYYFVLFEFEDINNQMNNQNIVASIWEVDPETPGFAFCMIDYYLNIRAKSKSKAPFNLWPYQLKFDIMCPKLIYRSIISENSVKTDIFPGENNPVPHHVQELWAYSGSNNLSKEKISKLAIELECEVSTKKSKREMLIEIQNHVNKNNISNNYLCEKLAKVIYLDEILKHKNDIPDTFKRHFPELN